jgi:hypothetical protein
MSGMTTANMDIAIRSEVWSGEIKDVLQDALEGQRYVRWLSEFPDGNTFTIPSIGELQARDYEENTAIQYDALDLGEFQFSITEYVSAATYITKKARQDSFIASEIEAQFVPKMTRAIMEDLELHILKEGQPKTGNPAGYQVAGATNAINGAAHRWVGSATVNSKRTLGVEDFARARFALKKANVPDTNLIAIVDPSVEYVLNTLTNISNISNNPRWEGIIDSGIASGMNFLVNIYGFDVYCSNRLALCGTGQTGTSETISSVASGAGAVCNLFFSMTPDLLPFVGAWRQMPEVDGSYNKDFQREEYVMTARYGTKIYRPENLVTVLADPTVIA